MIFTIFLVLITVSFWHYWLVHYILFKLEKWTLWKNTRAKRINNGQKTTMDKKQKWPTKATSQTGTNEQERIQSKRIRPNE